MSRSHKKWTAEEDKVLESYLKGTEGSIISACRLASLKLGRTESACSTRAYTVLLNPESDKYIGCVFTMIGRKSAVINKKTFTVKQQYKIPITAKIWNIIKSILHIR